MFHWYFTLIYNSVILFTSLWCTVVYTVGTYIWYTVVRVYRNLYSIHDTWSPSILPYFRWRPLQLRRYRSFHPATPHEHTMSCLFRIFRWERQLKLYCKWSVSCFWCDVGAEKPSFPTFPHLPLVTPLPPTPPCENCLFTEDGRKTTSQQAKTVGTSRFYFILLWNDFKRDSVTGIGWVVKNPS